MVWGTEITPVSCPYCGELIEVMVDPSAGRQRYVEDCQVCCRPMDMAVEITPDGLSVTARDENDPA